MFIIFPLQVQIPNNIFSPRLECFEYTFLIHSVNKNNISGICGPAALNNRYIITISSDFCGKKVYSSLFRNTLL